MSPKVPKEYVDIRREQILKAAWECFSEKGYHETKIRDIAKLMQVSTGVIYNYFKGKDEILDALLSTSQEFKKSMFARMAEMESARSALGHLFELHKECCPEDEYRKSIRGDIGLWAEALKKENLRDIFISQHKQMVDEISRIVDRGVKSGEIRSSQASESIANYILALMLGLQVQAALIDDIDLASFFSEAKELLCGNLWLDLQSSD